MDKEDKRANASKKYQNKMHGYLEKEFKSEKKHIDQLMFDFAQVQWHSQQDSRSIALEIVGAERLAFTLEKVRSKKFVVGTITYPREIVFKGLKPLGLKIFLNGTPHYLTDDKVVALKYFPKKNQIVVLYPAKDVPEVLRHTGWVYSVQETYDLAELGLERDMENLQNLEEHSNEELKNIIIGNQIIKKDLSFLEDRQFMRVIGGRGCLDHLNRAQKNAFDQIMSSTFTLVQGPPGTGKTTLISTTIIKMVKFLKWRERKSNDVYVSREESDRYRKLKILVCADSNQGVNNLCLNLVKMMQKTEQKVRFIWLMSPEAYLKEEHDLTLEKYIFKRVEYNVNAKNKMINAAKKKRTKILEETDVIFCTLLKASALEKSIQYFSEKLLQETKFPYTIVDEATQTTQPRMLGALKRSTEKIVLVGDPKQLSPVVLNHGIEKEYRSLFEDLIDNKKNFYCFLNTQYRMHPSICENPNHLFYDGRLKNAPPSKKNHDILNKVKKLFKNPQQRKIFYDVNGHERKADSSYYNPEEMDQVIRVLQNLVEKGVEYYEIGVIAMYNTQVSKLKQMIMHKFGQEGFYELKIGTVDSFQGSEKEFIILSTVRANFNGNPGFVNNKRRMNVALTRAKYGLFIVGNAITLGGRKGLWKDLVDDYARKGLVEKIGFSEKGASVKNPQKKTHLVDNSKATKQENKKNQNKFENKNKKKKHQNQSGNKNSPQKDKSDNGRKQNQNNFNHKNKQSKNKNNQGQKKFQTQKKQDKNNQQNQKQNKNQNHQNKQNKRPQNQNKFPSENKQNQKTQSAKNSSKDGQHKQDKNFQKYQKKNKTTSVKQRITISTTKKINSRTKIVKNRIINQN